MRQVASVVCTTIYLYIYTTHEFGCFYSQPLVPLLSLFLIAAVNVCKMSGLRAPSNYTEEPPRHPSLIVNSQVGSSSYILKS